MDKQFDKNLVNHVREVFDNFEDPSAAEGWVQLRKKFPEKRSRRPVAWIWRGAAAALLLLGLGIGFLVFDGRIEPKKMAHNKIKTAPSQNLVINKAQPLSGGKSPNTVAPKGNKMGLSPAIIANESAHEKNRIKEQNLPRWGNPALSGNQYFVKSPSLKSGVINSSKTQVVAQNEVKNGINEQKAVSKGNLANGAALAKNSNIPEKNIESPSINTNKTTGLLAANSQRSAGITDTADNKQQAVKPENSTLAAVKQAKIRKADDTDPRRVRFAISAGTFVNYAKGSNSQMNVGLGFTSDISLTRKLKLVTGIIIAQNSLNFTGTPPLAIQQNHLVTATAPSTASFASASFAPVSTPKFQNYNASLIALDIPINLKYQFNPKKSDAYVLAGVSSGTFIDEKYIYNYNYPSLFSPAVQQTLGTSAHSRFNNFYVAKVVNVAFGVGYPVGRNKLIIEPFLKYPLDGMGSQQLRFGTGGVNLKFNLLPGRK